MSLLAAESVLLSAFPSVKAVGNGKRARAVVLVARMASSSEKSPD